jgi:choline dehydrogenase-like flavoprotein
MAIFDLSNCTALPVQETDICIIGAGAAGLSLADALRESRFSVIVIESGPPQYNDGTPPPDDVIVSGHPFTGAREGRARAFGGTTNRWGGKCHRLLATDFAKREWVPHSGWPIGQADLDPYYRRAETFLNLGEADYSAELWKRLGLSHPALDHDVIEPGFSRFSAEVLGGNGEGIQDVGALVRPRLETSENVAVYCNGTAVELIPDAHGDRIHAVKVRNPKGDVFDIKSTRFVMCNGGIEAPRLLLCSRSHSPGGIGNGNDLVGRFFADHPNIEAGTIETDNPRWLQERYSLHPAGEQVLWANFTLPASVQEREGVLACDANIFFDWHPESGIQAAMDLYRSARAGRMIGSLGTNLWRIAKRFPEVAYYGSRFFLLKKWPTPRPVEIRFRCHVEQVPDPESRITLSDTPDACGMPIPVLDWRLHDLERRTAEVMVDQADKAFRAAGIGRVVARPWLRDSSPDWKDTVVDAYHHIGATRMSDSPQTGVVDRDCRVHSVDNLFICSSSVFPAGGSENPTLTIIALALRLGDHLKATARAGVEA